MKSEIDAFARCHPIVGFLFFIGAIGLGAVILHPAYILASGVAALGYYCILNGRRAVKTLSMLLPLFLIVTFLNPVFNHDGERVLLSLFGRPYTFEAFSYGMAIAGMLVVMLLWVGCYNAVMTSDKVIAVFGIRFPSISMLIVMVLRLVPNLLRKIRQISDVRRSIGRGVSENAGSKEKIVEGLNVLSVLMTWALEGGVITADSMKARGYGSGKRSGFNTYRMTAYDISLVAGELILFVAVILLIGRGGTAAEFTPIMRVTPIASHWAGFAAYCLFLLLPIILNIKEIIQWNISKSRI